jgi:hypothetical protein
MTAGRAVFIILVLAGIIFAFAVISDKWKPAGVERPQSPAPEGGQWPPMPIPTTPGARAHYEGTDKGGHASSPPSGAIGLKKDYHGL